MTNSVSRESDSDCPGFHHTGTSADVTPGDKDASAWLPVPAIHHNVALAMSRGLVHARIEASMERLVFSRATMYNAVLSSWQ